MNSQSINFSIKDAKFLRKWVPIDFVIERLDRAFRASHDSVPGTQRVTVDFSTNEIEVILETLADVLATEGITDGEVNSQGIYIDSLIDAFSNSLYAEE